MPKKRVQHSQHEFYGSSVLGERGQLVVPAKAREDFRLEKGERLLVFGMGNNMIALVKLEQAKEMAQRLSQKLRSINKVLRDI